MDENIEIAIFEGLEETSSPTTIQLQESHTSSEVIHEVTHRSDFLEEDIFSKKNYFHIVKKQGRKRGRPPKEKKEFDIRKKGKTKNSSVKDCYRPTNNIHVTPSDLMVNQRQKRKTSSRFASYLKVLKGEKDFHIDYEDPTDGDNLLTNNLPTYSPSFADGEVSLLSNKAYDVLSQKPCTIQVEANDPEVKAPLQEILDGSIEMVQLSNTEDDLNIKLLKERDDNNFSDFLLEESNFEMEEAIQLVSTLSEDQSNNNILDPVIVMSKQDELKYESEIHIHEKGDSTMDQNSLGDAETFSKQKFRCKICTKAYLSLLEARKHAKTHQQKDFSTFDKNEFKCSDCGRDFPTERGMNRHRLLVHLKNKSTQCEICYAQFNCFSLLEEHLRDSSQHNYSPTKVCKICKEKFVLGTSLEHHMEIQHPSSNTIRNSLKKKNSKKEPQQCPICKKMLPGVRALRNHRLNLHNGDPYTCQLCSFKTTSIYALKRHLAKVHKASDIFLYTCGDCDAGYHDVWDLEEHYICVHKRPRINLCSFCGKKFACIEMLRFHKSQHRAFSCELCHLGFTKEEALEDHLRKIHEKDVSEMQCLKNSNDNKDSNNMIIPSTSKNDPSSSVVRILEIGHDGSINVTKDKNSAEELTDMVFHLQKTKQGDLQELDLSDPLKGLKRKNLPPKINCPICNKLLTTNFLKVHMRSHQGSLPYKCHICGKAYAQATLLRKHMRNKHYEEYLKMGNKRPKKKKIKCDHCTIVFDDIYLLEDHLWSHMDNKQFECEACGIKFGMEISFKEHYKGHYFKESESCPICNKMFKSVGFYREHVERCQTNWQCEECGLKCENSDYYRIHKKAQHEGNVMPFQCAHCDKAFFVKHRYEDHILSHSTEKNFMCNFCHKTFKRSRPLKEHVAKYHGDTNNICEICNSSFNQLTELETHKRTHKEKRMCDECGITYLCNQTLNNHKAVFHESVDGKMHQCPFCIQEFKKQIDMKEHLIIHVPEASYPCQVDRCHKMFKKKHVLTSHMTRSHSYLDFSCYLCNMKLALDSDLQNHLAMHQSKSSNISCPKCNFTCNSKNLLEKHLLQHSRSYPFECSVCGYKSLFKRKMLRHIEAKHDVQQPLDYILVNKWKCSACEKMFINYNSLIKHLKRHALHNIASEGLLVRSSLSSDQQASYTDIWSNNVNIGWEEVSHLLLMQLFADTDNVENGEVVKTWQCPSCFFIANSEDAIKGHLLSASSCQECVVSLFLKNKNVVQGNDEGDASHLISSTSQESAQCIILKQNCENIVEKPVEEPILLMDTPIQFMINQETNFSILNSESISVPFLSVPSLNGHTNDVGIEDHVPPSELQGELQLSSHSHLLNETDVLIQMDDNSQLIIPKIQSDISQYHLVNDL